MIPTPAARLQSEPLVPPPPREAPLDLETLFFTRRMAAAVWSVDGRTIFFETNVTGRFNIWQVPRHGGWPVQLTVSDERTALGRPSPDRRWLLFTQDRAGNEKPNLYLQPLPLGLRRGPKTRRPRRVTATEGVNYRSIRWSPDGRALAFAAELAAPGAYDVYRLDPDSTKIERLAGHDGGQCTTVRWSRDGRRLAVTRTWDYAHGGVGVLDVATGKEHTLLPIDESADHQALGWTDDGRALLVSSNATPGGTYGVARVDAETGAVTWLDRDEWDIEVLDVSPAGDQYVCARNEGGTHAVSLRAVNGGVRPIALPPGVVGDAAFSPDGRSIALLHGAAVSPFELWVFDVPSGGDSAETAPVQLSRSLVGGLGPDDFVRPSRVVYPSFDGTLISAYVYLPPGARPDRSAPAVVYVHGGPAAQHMNGWVPVVQYLVSHGFAVIAPNYRGSTGFGRAFEEANMRDMGGGDLRDVVAAAEVIGASGYVDPRRVAVMGGSYGGYLTLMALTKYPDRWAAGVAIVPFANWFTEYEHEDQTLRDSDRARMGDPVEDADLWRDRSPIFFADRIRAPLLVLAGANDVRCPADEAEQIARAVRANGGVADLHIYPDEGHGFRRRENEIDAHRRTVEFLQRHLNPAGA